MKVTKVHPILALTQPFSYWMVTLHLVLSSPLFLLLSLSISHFCSMQKLIYTQQNVFRYVFLPGRCLSFIMPSVRFYEELKKKSSLSLYLLPFSLSLSLYASPIHSLYPSPFHPSLLLLLSLSLSPFLSFFSVSFSLAYLMEFLVIVHNIKYDLKGHMRPLLSRVIFKNFRSFDQITTLTYVLIDNFCPCFKVVF